MGLYDYINQIEKKTMFTYMVVFIIIMFLFKLIQPTFLHFFALITALVVIYYMNDKKITTLNSVNRELEFRLKSLIPKPEYFHLDSDLVVLFYNIKEYRIYNREAYDNALKSVDNLLHVKQDLETGVLYRCGENVEIAEDMALKAINHLHSIIHKVPTSENIPEDNFDAGQPYASGTNPTKKLMAAIDKLHLILKQHVDDMKNRCNKQQREVTGININTKFFYKKGPRPNDTTNDDKYDFYV